MWDKNRHTTLDTGRYNRDDNVSHRADIYYNGAARGSVDPNGNRYWVDQNGVRHYY